jgi:hypothetical protein
MIKCLKTCVEVPFAPQRWCLFLISAFHFFMSCCWLPSALSVLTSIPTRTTKGTGTHFVQCFKVIARICLAAFNAIGQFPVDSAGSDFALTVSSVFQAALTYGQGLYRCKSFHEFFSEVLGFPFIHAPDYHIRPREELCRAIVPRAPACRKVVSVHKGTRVPNSQRC